MTDSEAITEARVRLVATALRKGGSYEDMARAALSALGTAPAVDDPDAAYELGKRDGYEEAIQDLDLATGGDGEYKGSTFPGETVDVPVMKARIVERFDALTAPMPMAWRCFHCDEVFTDEHSARLHFGRDESRTPACQIKGSEGGLVEALRRAENDAADAWHAIHSETTDTARAYFSQNARHQEQLRAVEQVGYDRGIADAKAHPETLGLSIAAPLPQPATNDPLAFLRALPPGTEIHAAQVPSTPRKLAYNALTYCARQGYLQRLGYGRYRRTDKIASASAPATASEIRAAEAANDALTVILSSLPKHFNLSAEAKAACTSIRALSEGSANGK